MAELIKRQLQNADAAGFSAFAGCQITPYARFSTSFRRGSAGSSIPDIESLASSVAARIQTSSPFNGDSKGAYRARNDEVRLPWRTCAFRPFPRSPLTFMQLANNENVQLHQLSDLIATDPGFASEVLWLPNSPLYAPRYPASGILQAIAVLGANQLQACACCRRKNYLGKSLSHPAMRGSSATTWPAR